MFETIIVYTLTALFMFLFTKLAEHTAKGSWIFFSIPILIYTFVFGTRYYVGVDYSEYLAMYEEWDPSTSFSGNADYGIFSRIEIGFMAIIALCSKLHCAPYIYFSVISFIQISLIYWAFKDKKEVLAYSILALFLTGYAMTYFQNGLRQYLAISFFVLSLKYIVQQNAFKYILCICIACLFHKSALILIPVYFLYAHKETFCYLDSTKTFLSILFPCIILSQINITSIITSQLENLLTLTGYEAYIGSEFWTGTNQGLGGTIFLEIIILLILIFERPRVKQYYSDPLFLICFDLFFIAFCGHLLFFRSLITDRIFRYFTSLLFIVLGYYLNFYFKANIKTLRHALCAITLCFILLTYYVATIAYSEKSTSSYLNYFQYDKWQEKIDQKENFYLIQ